MGYCFGYVWIMGYGLVMGYATVTNSVTRKIYGLPEVMGYDSYGL